MRGRQWTATEEKQLQELVAGGAENVQIARTLRRSPSSIDNKKKQLGLRVEIRRGAIPESPLDRTKKSILAVLKQTPGINITELARQVNVPFRDLEEALDALKEEKYNIRIAGEGAGASVIKSPTKVGGSLTWRLKGRWIRFGVVADTHIGSKYAREDVLSVAYEHFKKEGLTRVYHAGNMVDGFRHNINGYDVKPEAGASIDRQLTYCAKVYPKVEGIETKFITGFCHEGWWAADGMNVGMHMEDQFRRHGRTDLEYIGHLEADIHFQYKDTAGAWMRLMHPGGGTSYALSYKPQKISEALQGGEKPQIQIIGHYHKHDTNYHREIWNIQPGCLQDQTPWSRKHHIQHHVGYCIVEVKQCSDGSLQSRRIQWEPYFDRGYYARWEEQDEQLSAQALG